MRERQLRLLVLVVGIALFIGVSVFSGSTTTDSIAVVSSSNVPTGERTTAVEGEEPTAKPYESSPGKGIALPATPKRDGPCFTTPNFTLTPLEQEVRRVYHVSLKVLREINATAWATDGTLLGMMRNGRIVTDRDVDLQIHSTYKGCAPLLASLKDHFARHSKLKSFKVVYTKHPQHGKIGRYVMVRMYREFGTWDTGVDFNCVYMDDPARPTFHVHRGTLEPVPLAVYPLGSCWLYDRPVPCPRDGMSVLEALKPRYAGCMVFPHCLGDPLVSVKKCMSPHPPQPLSAFVESTRQLGRCGFTSLADHYEGEPTCKEIVASAPRCETIDGAKLCFVQAFKG